MNHNFKNGLAQTAASFVAMATMINAMIVPALSSDAFTKAGNAVSSAQSKLVALADVLFPFSLVCLIIAILFTHDQKALATELKTALIICVAFVILHIVVDGGFVSTFTNLVSGSGSGTGFTNITPGDT